jgi:hypothetical protein
MKIWNSTSIIIVIILAEYTTHTQTHQDGVFDKLFAYGSYRFKVDKFLFIDIYGNVAFSGLLINRTRINNNFLHTYGMMVRSIMWRILSYFI